MPIKIQSDLPAREKLEREKIFVMDEKRAFHQDIRPIAIGVLNLMPLKEETEVQLLRALSNTPLQVDVSFVMVSSHQPKNTAFSHLNKFYSTFEEIKHRKFDGFIITGAPVEQMEYEDVDYWEELKEVMEWTKENVTSTFHICWGAQAALYYHYGVPKHPLPEKMFGLFEHKIVDRRIPLVRGFDDLFWVPHSRHTESKPGDIKKVSDIMILASSEEAGVYLAVDTEGRKIFAMGHPEYGRLTLDAEYRRDKGKGLDIKVPKNYYENDDPDNKPKIRWRSHSNNLYTNWLNYYVYQQTPYEYVSLEEIFGK